MAMATAVMEGLWCYNSSSCGCNGRMMVVVEGWRNRDMVVLVAVMEELYLCTSILIMHIHL